MNKKAHATVAITADVSRSRLLQQLLKMRICCATISITYTSLIPGDSRGKDRLRFYPRLYVKRARVASHARLLRSRSAIENRISRFSREITSAPAKGIMNADLKPNDGIKSGSLDRLPIPDISISTQLRALRIPAIAFCPSTLIEAKTAQSGLLQGEN